MLLSMVYQIMIGCRYPEQLLVYLRRWLVVCRVTIYSDYTDSSVGDACCCLQVGAALFL